MLIFWKIWCISIKDWENISKFCSIFDVCLRIGWLMLEYCRLKLKFYISYRDMKILWLGLVHLVMHNVYITTVQHYTNRTSYKNHTYH